MNKENEIENFREKVLPKYIECAKLNKDRLSLKSVSVKKCKICGKIKKLSGFYKNPLKSMGVFDECKDCCKRRSQSYRNKNRKLLH